MAQEQEKNWRRRDKYHSESNYITTLQSVSRILAYSECMLNYSCSYCSKAFFCRKEHSERRKICWTTFFCLDLFWSLFSHGSGLYFFFIFPPFLVEHFYNFPNAVSDVQSLSIHYSSLNLVFVLPNVNNIFIYCKRYKIRKEESRFHYKSVPE